MNPKKAWLRILAEAGIENLRIHDLRRTFRSRIADLGVAPHVAEKLIAHRLGGVLQIYDRAEYLPERVKLMQAWADYLDAIEQGAKVLPFRAA